MARKRNAPADPLQALSEYQRQGGIPSGDDIAGMLFDESDRGVVIILGSWVEDTLLERITEKLPAMSRADEKVLIDRGPLRDFNARILMAKALGLISESDKEILETIKIMRNACAHSRRDISFRTPELRAVLLTLLSARDQQIVERSPNSPVVPKAAFIAVCSFVLGVLQGETPAEAHARIRAANDELREAAERRGARLEPLEGTPRGADVSISSKSQE